MAHLFILSNFSYLAGNGYLGSRSADSEELFHCMARFLRKQTKRLLRHFVWHYFHVSTINSYFFGTSPASLAILQKALSVFSNKLHGVSNSLMFPASKTIILKTDGKDYLQLIIDSIVCKFLLNIQSIHICNYPCLSVHLYNIHVVYFLQYCIHHFKYLFINPSNKNTV